MTTEQTTQVTTTEATFVATEAQDGPAELRAALKREQDKAAQYRGELMESRLESIGLNKEAGLGKAIAKEYDGDMTVEAISAYAQEEYSYDGAVEQTPQAVVTGDRLETLDATSEPVTPPPPPPDEAAAITAKMNDPEAGSEEAKASLNAKTAQFMGEHYPT